MKSTFFARYALLILCVIFFLVPFALRGSRMSLERMENNVKDWLPDSFEETKELAWFAKHFVGEQSFILLTWEGCSAKDESFRLYVEKLRREVMPASESTPASPAELEESVAADPSDEASPDEDERLRDERLAEHERARQLGDEIGLFTTGDYHLNWGGRGEKWLRAADQTWYYITPNGELYHWHGRSNVLGALSRLFKRNVMGNKLVEGEYVDTFGSPPSKNERNDFHDNPRRLTARVLKSVTTGPEVLAELSAPGGSMWPIGTGYSDEERAVIARRRALDRLSGTLYGPEPYAKFQWTADDFQRVLHQETLEKLPKGWETRLSDMINQLVDEHYHGNHAELLSASLIEKERHWNELFQQLGVEPPGLQTCIMVTLSPPGTKDLRRVIGRGLLGKPRGKLVDLAMESGILPPSKPPMVPFVQHQIATGKVLRMGGPPVDNVAIDEEGQITLVRLVGFSILLGLGLSFACFRSVKVTIMVFMVGGISAVGSLSIVWWSGQSVDAILMSMPSLVYVLGLSGAVHIVNYYREASEKGGVAGAVERALAHGWMPCTLAAFTTALGLLSLYQSNIFPIRKFGLFSALGVMTTLILLFTYLPSALQLWPPHFKRKHDAESETSFHTIVHDFWQGIGRFVVERHWWVIGAGALSLLIVGIGLTKLNTSIQLLKLFDPNAKIIRDYAWLEEHVGKIVPMELVVSVDKKLQYPTAEQRRELPEPTEEQRSLEHYQYSFLERVELVSHVQDAVEHVFGEQGQDIVGRALSAATFTPPIVDPLDSQRVTLNAKLEQNRDRLLAENYLDMDDDQAELWRISVRLGALNDVDYGRFVARLKQVVEPVLSAYNFRDQILESIEAQRQDVDITSQAIWNDTRIAILGAGEPRHQTVDEEENGENQNPAESTDLTAEVDHIFAHVLGDLLRAKGYQGRKGGQIPKRWLVWNDPDTNPMSEDYRTSEKWASVLEKLDCVVLVKNHPSYDLDFIREHARVVIDAREHHFHPSVTPTAKKLGRPIQITYTGVVPIVYKAQRTLLTSLISSIGWAFVMICAVMMVLLRTRRWQLLNIQGGLVSMIPNVFPVVIIFGAMGHLNVLVDIGTMMTASVAMGVAVDDTIHFLTWFRNGIRQGMARNQAIQEAYSRVALAMTQTTLIGGFGLSIFAMSTFTPTQRFGTMMLTLLAAALVGDLVLLPAILASPLGKCFEPKGTDRQALQPTDIEGEPASPNNALPAVLSIDRSAHASPPDSERSDASSQRQQPRTGSDAS
jgi:predicted RND superfamily exporter protein